MELRKKRGSIRCSNAALSSEVDAKVNASPPLVHEIRSRWLWSLNMAQSFTKKGVEWQDSATISIEFDTPAGAIRLSACDW